MTISKDRVKPSPTPDSWKLREIFATGVVLGGYQAIMTVIFFWAAHKTDFFSVYKLFFIRLYFFFANVLRVVKLTFHFGFTGHIWCEVY